MQGHIYKYVKNCFREFKRPMKELKKYGIIKTTVVKWKYEIIAKSYE